MQENINSDYAAIEAYKKELEANSYDVTKGNGSADLIAKKGGIEYYFEIKKTAKKENIFGAATFTEWEKAFEMENNYFFVIAQEYEIKGKKKFRFKEISPKEFIKFSTIPPIKVNFNASISIDNNGELVLTPPKKRRTTTVLFDKGKFNTLNAA